MAKTIHYTDQFVPDFGMPWVPVLNREQLEALSLEQLAQYTEDRQIMEAAAVANPVGSGWTLPIWRKVMENWSKYNLHIVLGGNQAAKTTLGARLTVWAAGTIPEAEVYCWHVSEKRSIDDQQRFIYEALPQSVKRLPTKKGINHSTQYSQKNGFTDHICILPPHRNYRRGGSINFYNYAQFQQNDQIIEGIKANFVWCIAEGEMVQMANGALKRIESVRVGDRVLSINGASRPQSCRVTAVHDRGEKECVMVRPRNGTPVICTPDHEIFWGYFYANKTQAIDAKRIAQIRPGWWPKKTADRDDAWYAWMGLVVSEGCVAQKKVTSGSDAVIEKAARMLPPHAHVKRAKSPNAAVPDWFLRWPEFWAEMPQQVSATKEIPNWVFRSSRKKAIIFLRWLYQGDGWAYGHSIGYASTSYKLANQLVILLNRLGVRASFSTRKSKVPEWKDQYWVTISRAGDVVYFIDNIGIEAKENATAKVRAEAARRIESKIKRSAHFRTHGRRDNYWIERNKATRLKSSRVVTISNAGRRRVFDITVENEHRFFCGTSLVSNCDEKVPLALLETLKYRLFTYHGRLLLTYTVIDGWNDTIEKILAKTKTIENRFCSHPKINGYLPIVQESLSMDSCCIYYAWTDDNPFTDPAEFWRLNATADKATILARGFGIPTKSIAGAFPSFSRDVNVVPHDQMPWIKDPNYKVTRYMAIDPGGSKNWFMLWVAIDAAGTWWVYREWPDFDDWALPGSTAEGKPGPAQKGSGKGIKDYVELIKNAEDGEEIFERFIDPRMGAAEKQSQDGATTIISDLDECDFTVIPAPGVDIDNGLQLINNLLAWDESKPRDSLNSPHMFISDRCQNFIYAMAEYTGKGGRSESTKDPIDCARYLAVSNIDFIEAKRVDTRATGVY